MAKKSSVHQDSPANARVTRSQSLEPREQTAAARPARRDAATRSSKRGNVQRKSARRSEVVDNELTVVAEEDENEAVEQDDLFVPVDDDVRVDVLEDQRSNRLSTGTGISGTTAKTSFSQEEADQLKPQDIIDDLEDLATASEKLIQFVVPQGSDTPPETWKFMDQDRHAKLTDRLTAYKQSFGSSTFGQKYVSVRTVLRALFGAPELEQGGWRPDDVLYRVNLNEMIDTLLTVDSGSEKYNLLQGLETTFAVSVAGPDYDPAALAFWCRLAIQLTIASFETHAENPSADAGPHQVVHELFWNDEEFLHEESFGFGSINDEERTSALQYIQECVDELLSPFESDDWSETSVAVAQLRAIHPWDEFLQDALSYYDHRKQDLNDRIASVGNVDHIVDALTKEYQRRADIKYNEDLKRQLLTKGSTPRKSLRKSMESMAALKQQDRLLRQQTSTAPVAQMTMAAPAKSPAASAPQLGPQASPMGSDPAEAMTSPRRAAQAANRSGRLATGGKQARGSANMRSLMDRQPNAQRIDFDAPSQASPLPTRAREPALAASDVTRSSKRRADDEDGDQTTFDPTQDEGFESDERDTADADQRRNQIAGSSSISFPPRSSATSAAVGAASSAPARATRPTQAPSPKRQRKNPGSQIPPLPPSIEEEDESEPPPGSFYARAKTSAKQNRVAMPKPQQVRKPWSEDEENHLIDLIGAYCEEGISWTALKNIDESEGDVLHLRKSEDLRFKARNMKTTMLLARNGLPENWDKVLLDKKAIDKLRAVGVDYEQMQVRNRTFE